MAWHIVYKGKARRDTLAQNLERSGVEHFVPQQNVEYLDDDQMKVKREDVMHNLIFVKTDADIRSLSDAIDGLRGPFIDRATGRPAVVSDAEMRRFRDFLEMKNLQLQVLADPFQRFKVCQKVRVKAGDFEGTEGYVFRIRGDRKLVISLGTMAVAISGIHHSLLEPIDERP